MATHTKKLLIAFLITSLVGSALHFLHSTFPNSFTALISPVNESLWEHVKIMYWPFLVAALTLNRGKNDCLSGWFLSILIAITVMLSVAYFFHITLGLESMVFDISLYFVTMALAFYLPEKLSKFACLPLVRSLVTLAMLVLTTMILLYSFLPPDHILFADLSATNTWTTIPY